MGSVYSHLAAGSLFYNAPRKPVIILSDIFRVGGACSIYTWIMRRKGVFCSDLGELKGF